MATLTLTTLLPTFRFPFARQAFVGSLALYLFPLGRVSIPPLQSLLELLPPFLLAVPKKKTSHSRKAMRSANKGLKDKRNIVNCPACGSPKLAHHLCPACYTFLSRRWKAKSKQEGGTGAFADMPDLS